MQEEAGMTATIDSRVAPTGTSVQRVLLVDDHQTFAELLKRALDSEDDVECVGHARNGSEALQLAQRLDPDVVLMDLELPDGDGITFTADLVSWNPAVRVLILTAHAGPGEFTRAGAAGACGFLAKTGSLDELLDALRTAHRGSVVLPASVAAGLSTPAASRTDDLSLTPRELEVLRLLGRGLDPRCISRELGVSLHTCRGYVKSLLLKLGAHSQLEAVVIASRAGLIRVGE
jgi:DNA-binding NarL/FixJ family response regulator